MAHIYADRVADTSSTTGTGAMALDNANFTGYVNFGEECDNADTIYYSIQHRALDQWEVGLGTYGAGASTLTRTTVYNSSNAGSAVNFSSGIKEVYATFPAQVLSGIGASLTNVRLSKTANYTAAAADAGKTIVLSGSTCFTLTFGAASGYAATHMSRVVNADADRAKVIAADGIANFFLWPLQSVVVFNNNASSWQVAPKFQRWRPPAGSAVQMYCNDSTGVDANNDGLALASPLDKVSTALFLVADFFDVQGPDQATTAVQVNFTGTMNDAIHVSGPFTGMEGTAKVIIDGGSSSTATWTGNNASLGTVGLHLGAVLKLQNFKVANANSGMNCIELTRGARVVIGAGMEFGTCNGGAHIYITGDSQLEMVAGYTISGSAAYHVQTLTDGHFYGAGSTTVTISGTPAFTTFAYCNASFQDWSNITFSGSATGQRFSVTSGGKLFTPAGTASLTAFPGSTAGAHTLGGLYDGRFGTQLGIGPLTVSDTITGKALAATQTTATTDAVATIDSSGVVGGYGAFVNALNSERSYKFGVFGVGAGLGAGTWGIYDATAGGAAYRMLVTSAGKVGFGPLTVDRQLHAEIDDASNNTVTYVARLTHTTSGTPGNGIGAGLEFEVEAGGGNVVGATIEAISTDVTGASEDFDLAFRTIVAGSLVEEGRFSRTATATHTALMVYDVDNNAVERVTVGVADSGGAGFKLLRIPN